MRFCYLVGGVSEARWGKSLQSRRVLEDAFKGRIVNGPTATTRGAGADVNVDEMPREGVPVREDRVERAPAGGARSKLPYVYEPASIAVAPVLNGGAHPEHLEGLRRSRRVRDLDHHLDLVVGPVHDVGRAQHRAFVQASAVVPAWRGRSSAQAARACKEAKTTSIIAIPMIMSFFIVLPPFLVGYLKVNLICH